MSCLDRQASQLSISTLARSSKSSSSHMRGIRQSQARSNILAVSGSGVSAGANPQFIKFLAFLICPKSSMGMTFVKKFQTATFLFYFTFTSKAHMAIEEKQIPGTDTIPVVATQVILLRMNKFLLISNILIYSIP